MKLSSVYPKISQFMSAIKSKYSKPVTASILDATAGLEALSNSNKVLLNRAENQVEPLKKDFKSTKAMFNYAKSRCISALKSDCPYEHGVVMNIKTNKILAEYVGTVDHCSMLNLRSLPLDDKNTVVIHGHKSGFPVSCPDVRLLLGEKLNQVIAVTENGEFSLVAKRTGMTPVSVNSNQMKSYDRANTDSVDNFFETRNEEMFKLESHDNLCRHAGNLKISYLTNYREFVK